MITKDEILELLHSTETYRLERSTSTGDMDKFREAICAFANDLSGSLKKGYLILMAYENGGKTGGKVGGDVALIEMTDEREKEESKRARGNLIEAERAILTRHRATTKSGRHEIRMKGRDHS